ncbi:MAG: nucleotide exchange factor GrpE [Verrucomicrobia bacterium]|nr:nucleotide exchange factor GrpE [Verrucomicrobiota bacterium]
MTEPAPEAAPTPVDPAVRLAELEGEIARLKDTVLRSNADQQNQQRRHQREREELRKFATAGLLEDLLPALDSLALGLESAATQTDGRAVAEGFRLAIGQLRGILSAQGLVEVNPVGQPFDPARHEAVGSEASATVAEGTVLRVARAGWLLHDRVLRPAAVFVSSGPAQ